MADEDEFLIYYLVQVLLFEPSKNKRDEFVYIPSYVAYHSVEEGEDGVPVSVSQLHTIQNCHNQYWKEISYTFTSRRGEV